MNRRSPLPWPPEKSEIVHGPRAQAAPVREASGPLVRRWLALAREWWRPILTALTLCMAVLVVRPSDSIDRRISDHILVRQAVAPDPQIVIVEITGDDARRYGGPPIGREGLARLIDRLADGGARRVMVDIFLGERLDDGIDARLAAALGRLGPDRLGLVTAPTPFDLPYAPFRRHATVLDARLTPDIDGWSRHIGVRDGGVWGSNAARWLGTGLTSADPVDLDIRIASRRFQRRSAHQVITGYEDFSGKLVIVGTSSRIAPSRAFLPLTAVADRAAVLAVGAQSERRGYAARRSDGMWMGAALQVLAIALGFLCALTARSGRWIVATGLATIALLFAACISTGMHFAVEVAPVTVISFFLVMANVTLVQRLKIVPMMTSFLKGDVSPEEAWAWRGWEASLHPVLLFSADGRIKRSNGAAADLVARLGGDLVRLCIPRMGERAQGLVLAQDEADERSFSLEWPFAHIPIVIMRDTTQADALERALREQLLTDELTGQANRRGFEYALNAAARDGAPYCVFFLDMNGFKAVNDTHGHDAGDELLVVAATRLAGCLRTGDTVARLGGDEFAIVVQAALNPDEAERRAQRFADAIAEPVALASSDCTVRVGAAVGHAIARHPGEPTADVLRRADQAMYRNKAEGKARARAA